MSIIGEMWEEKYDKLERELNQLKESIPTELKSFADWLADNEFESKGYNVWTTSKDNHWGQSTYYTTELLVTRFLKENK